jgi:hypothetical protein
MAAGRFSASSLVAESTGSTPLGGDKHFNLNEEVGLKKAPRIRWDSLPAIRS